MDERTDQSLRNFLAAVSQEYPHLSQAYLFGSYAKEKQNKDSDIDIAIVLDHLPDEEKFDKQVQMMMLASRFDTRIEPHPMSIEDFQSGNPLPPRSNGRASRLTFVKHLILCKNMSALKIVKADYVAGLKLKIEFSDYTKKVVDFEPFLTHRPHQSFLYYQKPENFKKFKIEYGNVVLGKNWDVILPVEQLHQGKIEF